MSAVSLKRTAIDAVALLRLAQAVDYPLTQHLDGAETLCMSEIALTASTPAPPRQLVLLFDGTNNTLTAGKQDTNVLRLHAHLSAHPESRRILYYDPGVGSVDATPPVGPLDWFKRSAERAMSLASGRGVYENVAEGYLFLMRNWQSDTDQIWCFGFSRGAFTARCVSGMVNLFGILPPQYEALLPTLVRIYFSQPSGASGWLRRFTRRVHHQLRQADSSREALALQVRKQFVGPVRDQVWVHGVGVWDTVESVGLPGPLSQTNPSSPTIAGKRIRHVRHALALDEHRWPFMPRLYEEPGDIDSAEPRQTLKQRWFAGDHCDTGGGQPVRRAGLSDQSLAWMVDEFAAELQIPPWRPEQDASRRRHSALWDAPWWALAGMCLRELRPHVREPGGAPIATIAAPASGPVTTSDWAHRRPWLPLAVALLAATLALVLSGLSLIGTGLRGLLAPELWPAAIAATQDLALAQLTGALSPRRPGIAWAMAWDLAFVVAWGYLLARVASRAFAWAAGASTPGQRRPWWQRLGMAPLVAVGGDVAEDLLTIAALVLQQSLGAPTLAALLTHGAIPLAALLKFAGLAGCVPWLALRLWIALPGVRRVRN